jgi:hypothetical protein
MCAVRMLCACASTWYTRARVCCTRALAPRPSALVHSVAIAHSLVLLL